MFYAGIGSRNTPAPILDVMTRIGTALADKGYTLRSGGANGADLAFEKGCDLVQGNKEIYLPWKGFNKNPSTFHTISREALRMGEFYHPYWSKLSNSARLFHSRNCYQVLGLTLDNPVDFVVCWTTGVGGTQQALRIAKDKGIQIYNLIDSDVLNEFEVMMDGLF